ncbi:MAG: hypothetical protein E6R03_03700 [Hyphomicrobiaceae bacterium]|nr:MAG: hypothetical protein E6R03_03700 [Hyphomicrobiaceae bacterium]
MSRALLKAVGVLVAVWILAYAIAVAVVAAIADDGRTGKPLTLAEAKLIAERMPEPDASLFLYGREKIDDDLQTDVNAFQWLCQDLGDDGKAARKGLEIWSKYNSKFDKAMCDLYRKRLAAVKRVKDRLE